MLFTCFVVIVAGYYAFKWLIDAYFPIDRLHHRHVLVTGCDTGFGHALALKLIEKGLPTFAGCLTEQGEVEFRKKASLYGGKFWTIRLDVTDQKSVDDAFRFVTSELGPRRGLWGVVNNAGVAGDCAPDDWLSVKEYQKTFEVNFFGVCRISQTFKPLLKIEKGRMVNVTSVLGRITMYGAGPYAASKYAAESYSDLLRHELKPFGVSVHILEPGFFATSITDPSVISKKLTDLWRALPDSLKKQYDNNFLKSSVSALKENLQQNTNPNIELVVDAYYHALTSRLPKQRYYVGWDSRLIFVPLSMMPTWLSDLIFQRFMRGKGQPEPNVSAVGI